MQSLKKWIYQDKPEIIETDMGYSKLISMIGNSTITLIFIGLFINQM
ncbi:MULTISPECIES: hypothetical protein [Psychrobacillus]|uniref:Uncharacterized protein n=1 Tax=Psychrobacillus faecigallinarum TaxID=2762235 RepID=A0ABR8RAI2_9BACI|nr:MULTISPECIES: hypothetical protein [Psychrobacillus]MBD7944542.1 hypothetical protein [Psychrobacillus faecigallinarum]QGM30064.1 hypothetical protein GI482_06595 [Bacillus sp. N3536]